MEINCNDLEDDFKRNYDICIIGAGAAGLTILNELAGSNCNICILESGGFSLDAATQSLYDFENIGIPRKSHNETRLRMFGGTTNHWTGRCGPFDKMDFEKRDWIPHSGWPIKRNDLEPYYIRSASYCDLTSYPFDNKITADKFIPLPAFSKNTLEYHLWQFSEPTRFGVKYRNIVNDNNIELIYNANVSELLLSENEANIKSAKIKTLAGKSGTIQAKQYILCTGGIENARILLYSNSVNPHGVGNQHDQLGRYFMEHPRASHEIAQLGERNLLSHTFNNYQWQEGQFLLGMKTSSNYQLQNKTLNSGYWYMHRQSDDATINRLRSLVKSEYNSRDKADDISHILKNTDDIYANLRRRLFSPGSDEADTPKMLLVTETEQAPNPHSRITLSDEKDALGLAKSKIDWNLSELDRRNAENIVHMAAIELAKSFNVRLRLPEWMSNNEANWQNNFTDVSHHLGTTRMSDSPATGIVNSDCKVHGVDNLSIAGGSVFSTSSHINPTFTIVALAIRLADHIKIRLSNC